MSARRRNKYEEDDDFLVSSYFAPPLSLPLAVVGSPVLPKQREDRLRERVVSWLFRLCAAGKREKEGVLEQNKTRQQK